MKNRSFFNILSIVFLLLIFSQANAQIEEKIIGIPCPDFYFDKMVNYKSADASIADFKGKWLILDFWGATCTACVEHIPALESLQKKFKNKIQVLLIGIDGEIPIRKLYAKRKKQNKAFQLPSAIDSATYRFFGFNGVPEAQVWIDDKGIITAITGDETVTEKNVQRFLDGRQILPVAIHENLIPDNFRKLFFADSNHHEIPDSKYYTVLTPYTNGLRSTISYPQNQNINAFNASITSLYMLAYADINGQFLPYSRIRLEIKDSALYPDKIEITDKWQEANLYCYKLMVSGKTDKELLEIMKQDLDRFFDYKASMEKRKEKCWALVQLDRAKLNTTHGKTFEKWDPGEISIQNKPLSSLLSILQYYHMQKIILDETGYTSNADIVLDADVSDLNAVKKSLNKYGLDLVETEREINMLIIKDKINQSGF